MAKGKTAFVELNCTQCHRVDGVPELPAPPLALDKVIVLGGNVAQVQTYGDLITAVIPPPSPHGHSPRPDGRG
jgi:hypothetical protein